MTFFMWPIVTGIPRGTMRSVRSGVPKTGGQSWWRQSGLSMAFQHIMESAEIKGQFLREANGEGRSQSSLSFHSLGHGFVSAMAKPSVAQELRQRLTGHISAKMNAQYTRHQLQAFRQNLTLRWCDAY